MLMLAHLVMLASIGFTSAVNPGAKARITANGISYANTIAQAVLATELKTLKIPNQSGKDGHIEWSLTSIENRGCTVPKSQISLVPAHTGLSWTLTNLGLSIHADWRIKYRKGWIKFSTSGNVDVNLKQVSLSVTISLGKDKNGRPSMTAAACSVNIGDVDLHFHGGISWLIRLFKHPLEKKVKNLLKEQICKIATREINVDGNKALAKLKVNVEIDHRFLLDYSLVAAPVVTSTFLEIQDKGEVYWKTDKKEAPFAPKAIPPLSDVSRMLYLWLTEYSANSFFYVAQTHNYLKLNVSRKDLPGGNSSYLNTTCKILCIGKLVPQIGQKYPNAQVKLVLATTSNPQLSIQPKNVTAALKGHVDMYAEQPGKPSAYLLTLNLTLGLSLSGAIKDQRLVGKIINHRFKIGVVKSAVGKLNPAALNIVLGGALDLAVIPILNKIAEAGVDLPVTNVAKFKNTSLTFLQGSLVIATDIIYQPKLETGGRLVAVREWKNFNIKRVKTPKFSVVLT